MDLMLTQQACSEPGWGHTAGSRCQADTGSGGDVQPRVLRNQATRLLQTGAGLWGPVSTAQVLKLGNIVWTDTVRISSPSCVSDAEKRCVFPGS